MGKRDGGSYATDDEDNGAPSDMGFLFFSIPLTVGTFGWRLDDPELEIDASAEGLGE